METIYNKEENIRNIALGSKVKIKVNRTFGSQNIIDVYSDYVANKIQQDIRSREAEKVFNIEAMAS